MNVISKLNNCVEKKGAGFIVLIDPDKKMIRILINWLKKLIKME